MNLQELPPFETWGRRLSREAQRLRYRHIPSFSWLRELAPTIANLAALPIPDDARFRRTETPPEPRLATLVQPQFDEEDLGAPLAASIRGRLEPLLGPGLEAMRIHVGASADNLARSHDAAAVTVGRDVYFRYGSYQPQEPSGLALLAHEAEHILQALRPNVAWHRATIAGLQEEERQAMVRERNAFQSERFVPHQLTTGETGAIKAGQPRPEQIHIPLTTTRVVDPVQRPMTARVDRDDSGLGSAQENSGPDLAMLRRELYRDLMSQIRADLERGA